MTWLQIALWSALAIVAAIAIALLGIRRMADVPHGARRFNMIVYGVVTAVVVLLLFLVSQPM